MLFHKFIQLDKIFLSQTLNDSFSCEFTHHWIFCHLDDRLSVSTTLFLHNFITIFKPQNNQVYQQNVIEIRANWWYLVHTCHEGWSGPMKNFALLLHLFVLEFYLLLFPKLGSPLLLRHHKSTIQYRYSSIKYLH
jgi:hypothetical protein